MNPHERLRTEGRCVLSLVRSDRGRIRLTMKTHALGAIEMELDAGAFADLVFGVAETPAVLTRILPGRTPAYSPILFE